MTIAPFEAPALDEERADGEIVGWFTNDIGRAFRALEVHRPNAHGKCGGCPTQMRSTVWPCRLTRLALVACETVAARKSETPTSLALKAERDDLDAPFHHAIRANSIETTAPMRAVSRTPAGARPVRSPSHGKK